MISEIVLGKQASDREILFGTIKVENLNMKCPSNLTAAFDGVELAGRIIIRNYLQ